MSSKPAERVSYCSTRKSILLTIIFVFELIVFSSSSKSIVHSDAGEVLVAPSLGGWRGTYRIVPPGISMLLMYLYSALERLEAQGQGSLLVKEGLEDDDLVSWFDESHESTQHSWSAVSKHFQTDVLLRPTFICAGGDGNFRIRVYGSSEGGRVCIRNGLLKSGTALYRIISRKPMASSLKRSAVPLWANTGCTRPGRELPWPHQERIEEGCSRCFINFYQFFVPTLLNEVSLTRSLDPCSQSVGPAKRQRLR